MKCINCGAENENGARFCFNCGSSIVSDVQPQNFVDQTQDISEMQPQYGYEQSQYGYEQPQYSYEQPRYEYEQPAAPAKKSKKGAVIAVLVVVLLLVILGFVGYIGYQQGWFDDILNKEQPVAVEEETGPEVIHVNKNKMYERGSVELWLVEPKTYEGPLNPANAADGYITPLPDDPNSYYFGVCFRVKNVSDDPIDFNNLHITGSLDDKYNLSDRWELYYESDDSSEFDNNSIIEPDEIKTVYFVCSISNTYVETYKKMTLSFGFDSDFSSKPLTKGENACDYIFNFVGVK